MPKDKTNWIAEQALTIQRLIKNNPAPVDADALKTIVSAAFAGRPIAKTSEK